MLIVISINSRAYSGDFDFVLRLYLGGAHFAVKEGCTRGVANLDSLQSLSS